MRILRGITPANLGLSLALIGLFFALAQPGLSAIGFEVTPLQGYTLLVLAALCGIGAPIALFWHFFGRLRIVLVPVIGAPSSPAASSEIAQLQEQVEQLTAERDALRDEKRQARITEWRFIIQDFDFATDTFASTGTYSQMKPHLRSEVIEMFETPRGIHVGNEARGDLAYGYTLLDEVARIEKEWGLIY